LARWLESREVPVSQFVGRRTIARASLGDLRSDDLAR
jgi:hypothetical protein